MSLQKRHRRSEGLWAVLLNPNENTLRKTFICRYIHSCISVQFPPWCILNLLDPAVLSQYADFYLTSHLLCYRFKSHSLPASQCTHWTFYYLLLSDDTLKIADTDLLQLHHLFVTRWPTKAQSITAWMHFGQFIPSFPFTSLANVKNSFFQKKPSGFLTVELMNSFPTESHLYLTGNIVILLPYCTYYITLNVFNHTI